jgi:O-antigen/teichoic acid export membrane protein
VSGVRSASSTLRRGPNHIWSAARSLRRPGLRRSITRTALFNVGATGTTALAGLVIARTLGPSGRGDYAAVTAWFGVVLIVGSLGQPAAICYFVSSHTSRARDYVTTSRLMMLVSGFVAAIGGIFLAPLLAHGQTGLEQSYRLAFIASLVAMVATTYTYSLQAVAISRWNIVMTVQPLAYLAAVIALRSAGVLSVRSAVLALAGSLVVQLIYAWHQCAKVRLTGGRMRRDLLRRLTRYGVSQLLAVAPATVNLKLDQVVLSQTVPSADLGRYAVAATLTSMALPAVAAIGNVAFPRLAALGAGPTADQLQRRALIGSAVSATAILSAIALSAYWVVPALLGEGFRAAVPMIWILTPGGVFLACGQVAGDLLRGRNRPLAVAYAQGFAAVLTVVLLAALIPIMGAYGAAVASTIAYGLSLAFMVRALRHPDQQFLPKRWNREAKDLGSASEAIDEPRREVLQDRLVSEPDEFDGTAHSDEGETG